MRFMRKAALSQLQAICPCRVREGGAQTYAECCAPAHQGTHAPTPEALMRSRYSAYVVGDIPYLLATWHPSNAPGDLELSPTQWLGLEVLHHEQTGEAGVVEFIARFKVNGRAEKTHEVSRFVRESGQWLYIDGTSPDGEAVKPEDRAFRRTQ
jgi:SEC-C motif domain protein